MNVKGFNHITLNISDLERSLEFYQRVLRMSLVHKGRKDAYLEWGEAWICLLEKKNFSSVDTQSFGVNHFAFSIAKEDFFEAVHQLENHDVTIVRGPIKRGKGWTINFLDPDGIEMELHTSNLQERMTVWE
ncbi:metallothiol transferase [Salinibacillus kushneri]|uniref:Metallothiol transferase n=1 Tax=Salinibacillus kushneri TaxID=237682 RepID=A0A1I0AUY8_9BACI|nr:VOC family protein [Salinibacillus kushneri]SES97605.1 metallothiol transferase [Salinibacillus kushneri]